MHAKMKPNSTTASLSLEKTAKIMIMNTGNMTKLKRRKMKYTLIPCLTTTIDLKATGDPNDIITDDTDIAFRVGKRKDGIVYENMLSPLTLTQSLVDVKFYKPKYFIGLNIEHETNGSIILSMKTFTSKLQDNLPHCRSSSTSNSWKNR